MKKKVVDYLPSIGLWVGSNAFGAWYRLNRYRGGMYRRMREWQALESLPYAQIEWQQLCKLRMMLRQANYTTYYAAIFRDLKMPAEESLGLDFLSQLPILDRNDVIRHYDDLQNREFRGRVVAKRSSGTTGVPVQFLQPNRMAYDETYATLYNFYGWHGIRPLEKRASFVGRYLGRRNRGVAIVNRFERQLVLGTHSLSAGNVVRYVNALCTYQPALLQGHPSALKLFVELCRKHGLEMPVVRKLAFTGETLLEEDREFIMDAFKGQLFGTYGMGEGCLAASECPELNGYHVNPMVGIVELIENRDGDKEIVATSLLNNAMPFIRYRTGDIATRIEHGICRCGNTWPRIMGLMGRADDVITAKSGDRILPVVLRTEIREKFRMEAPYSIVRYKGSSGVTLRVYSDDDKADRYMPLCNYLSERLGPGVNVEFEAVPYRLFLTSRAKHKIVISE